jgi:hypothetical protein
MENWVRPNGLKFSNFYNGKQNAAIQRIRSRKLRLSVRFMTLKRNLADSGRASLAASSTARMMFAGATRLIP